MKTKIEVISAVLTAEALTLYLANGEIIKIAQGSPILKHVLDLVMPSIMNGKTAVISMDELNGKPVFEAFEKKTNGLVKFFTVAKSKLAAFFEKPVLPELDTLVQSMDSLPKEPIKEEPGTSDPSYEETVKALIQESPSPVPEENTIIAIVNETDVVPDIVALKGQIKYAEDEKETGIGLTKFLQRVGAVAKERRHTVQDLMKFMERGDLPIADDGSIVAYKILSASGTNYVDCHTKKVTQNVGSYVYMDPSLVDPDRSNECSNGLHIARRGYLGIFPGDACFIVKIAPENCIAVPHGDANKMRVCGYHIVAKLSPEQFATVRANKPMTGTDAAQRLLADVLAGKHIGITNNVCIGGPQGTNVTTTKVDDMTEIPTPEKLPKREGDQVINTFIKQSATRRATAIDEPEKTEKADVVDPVKVAKQIATGEPTNEKHALALKLVREGKTISQASKESGVHRRSIDRLVEKYGK